MEALVKNALLVRLETRARKGLGMKRSKSTAQFWIALATINVLALVYPINLVHRANSMDDNFFAILAAVGIVFALILVDTVSILLADVMGSAKRRRAAKTLRPGAIGW